MELKRGIDTFPSKLGENRLIQRTAVSVLALICGGFAMALGTPPTEHEVISASIQLEISEVSKDLNDHLSLFKLPSEIFEEITGVAHENRCFVLGDSSTSLVQPILVMSIVDSYPQLSTIGSAVQLQTEPTSKYSDTETTSNETETFELTSSGEINTYQITTEIWSGTVVGYAITFDLHCSLSGDSSIVAFYPMSIQGSELDLISSRANLLTQNIPDCMRNLNFDIRKINKLRADCDSGCSGALPMLKGVFGGALTGATIATRCPHPTGKILCVLGGALVGEGVRFFDCGAGCGRDQGSRLEIALIEYEKCLADQIGPNDTSTNKPPKGTSPK